MKFQEFIDEVSVRNACLRWAGWADHAIVDQLVGTDSEYRRCHFAYFRGCSRVR